MSKDPTASPEPEPAPEVQPVASGKPPMIESTADDRTMAMLCHIGGAIFSFWVPLIIWLIKKDQSKFVNDQGKEALNFHITLIIGHVIGGITMCITFGLINLAVWIVGLVFGIIGGLASQKGEVYRYPFTLRLIK